jgi:hypothetical protein
MKANFAFFTVAIDVVDIFGQTIDFFQFLAMKQNKTKKPLFFNQFLWSRLSSFSPKLKIAKYVLKIDRANSNNFFSFHFFFSFLKRR